MAYDDRGYPEPDFGQRPEGTARTPGDEDAPSWFGSEPEPPATPPPPAVPAPPAAPPPSSWPEQNRPHGGELPRRLPTAHELHSNVDQQSHAPAPPSSPYEAPYGQQPSAAPDASRMHTPYGTTPDTARPYRYGDPRPRHAAAPQSPTSDPYATAPQSPTSDPYATAPLPTTSSGFPARTPGMPPGPAPALPSLHELPLIAEDVPKGDGKRTSKLGLGLLAGGLSVALIAAFGVGAYYLIEDSASQSSPQAAASPVTETTVAAEPAGVDLSSQANDPEPLTEAELFPGATIEIEGRAYHVQKTQILTDCKQATTGKLAETYTKLGCSQVVRATLLSPDKTMIATIGVFNFTDQAAASSAKLETKTALTSETGSISGWTVNKDTEVVTKSETYLSWLPVGHYLAYCVLAKSDSTKPNPEDPAVQQMLTDTVETYLRAQVKRRAGA